MGLGSQKSVMSQKVNYRPRLNTRCKMCLQYNFLQTNFLTSFLLTLVPLGCYCHTGCRRLTVFDRDFGRSHAAQKRNE